MIATQPLLAELKNVFRKTMRSMGRPLPYAIYPPVCWWCAASHWKTIAHFLFSFTLPCCVGDVRYILNPWFSSKIIEKSMDTVNYVFRWQNKLLFIFCVYPTKFQTNRFEFNAYACACVHNYNPQYKYIIHVFKRLPQIFLHKSIFSSINSYVLLSFWFNL